MRRVLVVLLVLLIVVLGALFAAHTLLRSERVRHDVAARLEEAAGLPVTIGAAQIGVTGDSTLRDLQLHEAGAAPGDAPWATVEALRTDLSAWDILRGAAVPQSVTLVGAEVTLRFDRAGRLLTRLPQGQAPSRELPLIYIERGIVTLRQEGRPAMTVRGVTGTVRPEKGQICLEGSIADDYWGKWTLDGCADAAAGSFEATLKTDEAQVTPEKLTSLPFIPPHVWEEVKASGPTPVTFHYRHLPGATTDHYRVELTPRGATVDIPSIALHAEKATGRVVVEDDVVELTDVTGQALGGTLTLASARLDFRGKENRLTFTNVRAEGLDMRALPKEWDIPEGLRRLGGRLNGQASLRVTFNGAVKTEGEGTGRITGVTIAGQEADIRLRLRPTGRGYRFDSSDGERSLLPADLVPLVTLTLPPPQPSAPTLANDLLRLLQRGIDRGTRQVLDVGQSLLDLLPQKSAQKPTEPKKAPSYLDVSLRLQDADIVQLAEGIGVPLPVAVTGRVSFDVQASFPIDTPRDLKTYRVRGNASSPRLTVAGVALEKVSARVRYADGVLQLEELQARLPGMTGGSVSGTARLGVIPEGDLTAQVKLDGIALREALSFNADLSRALSGTVSGTADLRIPAGKWRDQAAWRGTARLTSDRIQAYDWTARDAEADLVLENSVLTARDLKASVYGGRVTGRAEQPLDLTRPGRVSLRLADVDVGALMRDTPALPIRVEGKAGGTVEATVTPRVKDRGPEVKADLDLTAPRLRLQNFTTERVTGSLNYRNGSGDYQLRGEAFGGKFQLEGKFPAQPAPQQPAGRFRLNGAQLWRLGEAFGQREALGPLQGTIDAALDFDIVDGEPTGRGTVVVSRLRWGDVELSSGLRGELRLSGRELRLRDLNGTVAEGLLRGQVGLNLREWERSWFSLALERFEARRLLAPWPTLAGLVQGTGEARLRGSLGTEWRGGGDVVLTRGRLFGVDVTEWRLPITFALAPGRGRGEVDIPETSAQLARGRLSGRAHLGFGYGSRLEGHLRLYGVDLQTVLRQGFDLTQVGSGQVTARIDFSGHDVRSLNDVTATVDASFSQTQAFQLPVLSQLVPYIAPGQSNTTFQSGELRGRLANGLFRVQRLSLSGQPVNLFANGTVGRDGRLNLDVVATTGRVGVNPNFLRLLGVRLPPIGPIPVGLVLQVTDYLSNRTVYLRVTGTLRSPSVRVEPLPLLTEEAVRYFLNRYNVPIP